MTKHARNQQKSEPTVAVGVRLRKDLLGEVNRLAKSSKQSRNRTMAHLIEVGLSKAA